MDFGNKWWPLGRARYSFSTYWPEIFWGVWFAEVVGDGASKPAPSPAARVRRPEKLGVYLGGVEGLVTRPEKFWECGSRKLSVMERLNQHPSRETEARRVRHPGKRGVYLGGVEGHATRPVDDCLQFQTDR